MSKELEGLNLVSELRRLSIFHLPALSAHIKMGRKNADEGGSMFCRYARFGRSKFKVPNL